ENLTPDSPFCLMGIYIANGGIKATAKRMHSHGTEMNVGNYPWEEDEMLSNKPYWLRITLRGDEFTAEVSPDSLQWTRVGYERVPMGPRVYAGLVVEGNKEANAVAHYTTAKFSRVRINN
ncbi:hypothetical protein AB4Z54_37190, partial [Streptomyces sp. MCAF7]